MANALRRLLRIDSGASIPQAILDYFAGKWIEIAAVVAGGAGMSYLAIASEWLRPYAPVSWGLAGLIGLLILSVICCLVAKARDILISSNINREFYSTRHPTINPLDSTFERQRIHIVELVTPFDKVVRSKTFIDCDLIGPANVAIGATSPGAGIMANNSLFKCIGVLMKDGADIAPADGMIFQNCTIVRCRLYGLTLYYPESWYGRHGITNLPWITPVPNITSPPTAPPLTPIPTDTPEKMSPQRFRGPTCR